MPVPSSKKAIIAGRYELLNLVAEGGHAVVWSAWDRHTQQCVAVKILGSACQNQEFVQRLAREQEAMLALAGTNAAAVFDLCVMNSGVPCLVMELLEGKDLERYLSALEQRGECLSADRLFEIFEPVVETLTRAHALGILHRDLKPANIFVISEEAGGGVRLLDFGLARLQYAARLTAHDIVLGSPSYIAPEAWGGQPDDLDSRADVYSLAVILFRALSGRLPFDGETMHDKWTQATTAARPSLKALRPDLPAAIDVWVEQALAIDPAQRFPSARALFSVLLSILDYSPSAQAVSRVPESLVTAWRAAGASFRRLVTGAPAAIATPIKVSTIRKSEPVAEWLDDEDVFNVEDDDMDQQEMLAEMPSAVTANISAAGSGRR